jgi:poly(A) polymerase
LVYRFANKLGTATPLMVLHSLADCAATRGNANVGSWEAHLSAAATILEHYFAQDKVTAPPVLLDGNAIMELLSIPPGPVIGELKVALLEATAAGDVDTLSDAEAYISALWKEKAGN